MHLSNKQYDLWFLTAEFEGVGFELFSSGDNLFMTCIACWCERANDVLNNWNAMQSLISAYFQPPGHLAKWNIYFVIFCSESLPLREKYVIQNDKYAVRKVIFDGLGRLPTQEEAEEIINNELLGEDLSIVEVQTGSQQTINTVLAEIVSGAPSDMSYASKLKRADMINNIIGFLKENEDKKS